MQRLLTLAGWLLGSTNLLEELVRVGTTLITSVLYLTCQWTLGILHWHA
jgi:hypothetical protein